MKGCPSFQELLFDYQAELLTGEEKDSVTIHLRECAACRQHFSRLEAERKFMAELLGRLPPPDLSRRVLQRTHRFRRFRIGQVAAAVAIGVLLTLAVHRYHFSSRPLLPLQVGPFWEEHLQAARLPPFNRGERSPLLLLNSLAGNNLEHWVSEVRPPGEQRFSSAREYDPLSPDLEAPPALPHGYIFIGGRNSPRGNWTQWLYTDGLRLLSVFKGRIPGTSSTPVEKEINGDLGDFRLRAWKGGERDYLVLGPPPARDLGDIAVHLGGEVKGP